MFQFDRYDFEDEDLDGSYDASEDTGLDGLFVKSDRLNINRPDWGLLISRRGRPFDTDSVFIDANDLPTQELIHKVDAIYGFEQGGQAVRTSNQHFIRNETR